MNMTLYPMSCDVQLTNDWVDYTPSTATTANWYPTVTGNTAITVRKKFRYSLSEVEDAICRPKIKIQNGFNQAIKSIDFSYPISSDTGEVTVEWDCYDSSSSTWNYKTLSDATTCYLNTDTFQICHGPVNPLDRLREMIRHRQAPMIIGSRKHLQSTQNPAEIRARQTLHRVLGDNKFRGFIKNGFVSVRGKSGLVYQIQPGHNMTKVYDRGQHIETLCVVLSGNFPPTDSLIMRYLLILNSESNFRKHAVSHKVHRKTDRSQQVDQRPLTEIFKELKVA